MDQHGSHSSRNLEVEETVMTEHMERINERVQETVEGVQSTVHRAMEGFKQMHTTGGEVKTAVDDVLDRVKGTVNEITERVKPAVNLLGSQQNTWLLVGGAVLLGYILGSLAREDPSAP